LGQQITSLSCVASFNTDYILAPFSTLKVTVRASGQ